MREGEGIEGVGGGAIRVSAVFVFDVGMGSAGGVGAKIYAVHGGGAG